MGTVTPGEDSFVLGHSYSLLQESVTLAATLAHTNSNDPKGSSYSTSCYICQSLLEDTIAFQKEHQWERSSRLETWLEKPMGHFDKCVF